MFINCRSLTELKLPRGLETIREHAFEGCTGLSELRIPDSVQTIRRGAFWGCSGLQSVTLPAVLSHKGNDLFEGCTGLSEIKLTDPSVQAAEKMFLSTSKFEDKVFLAAGLVGPSLRSSMLEEYIARYAMQALKLLADQFNDAMFVKVLTLPTVTETVNQKFDELFEYVSRRNNMKIKAILMEYRQNRIGYNHADDEFEL